MPGLVPDCCFFQASSHPDFKKLQGSKPWTKISRIETHTERVTSKLQEFIKWQPEDCSSCRNVNKIQQIKAAIL